MPAQRSIILPIVILLAVEEPARVHKLFHGLEGTNQGIHQRQPGTVLSTGFSRHSGEVLSFDDQTSFLPGPPVVKPYPPRLINPGDRVCFHDQG